MSDTEEKKAKDRILEAAIGLFAQKGYSATGLREIVKAADVSVAMVNYHFGTKQALLEEIIQTFFSQIYVIAQKCLVGSDSAEQRVRKYFDEIIGFYSTNLEQLQIVFHELPREIPGLVDLKASLASRLVDLYTSHILPALPPETSKNIRTEIVGPAMMGMMTFHFLMRPVVERVFGIEFNTEFYHGYADHLADLFFYGVLGHSTNTQPANERNSK